MNPRHRGIFLRAARADKECSQQRPDDPKQAGADAPTHLDVLNGRGHRVYRHPGNAAYRELVSASRGLYVRGSLADKAAISKRIVAAVRDRGGRFLELDKLSGIHFDIGDKKAWEKTSQALREGQKKIRQKLHSETTTNRFDASPPASCAGGRAGFLPGLDTAPLASFGDRNRAEGTPQGESFGHSAELLGYPCSSDDGVASQTSTALPRAPQSASSGGGLVERALVGRYGYVPRSFSPDLENEYSRVAARLEDGTVRYLSQVCGGNMRLMSSLLRRASLDRGGGVSLMRHN